MGVPRVTIAALMTAVAVAALDGLALRSWGTPPVAGYLIVAGLPMQGALLLGLARLSRPGAGGRPRGLLGFEAAGLAVFLVYVAVCVRDPDRVGWHVARVLAPVLAAVPLPPDSAAALLWRHALVTTALTVPQLTAAASAGWAYARWTDPARARPDAPLS